jgi:hypothetical protein
MSRQCIQVIASHGKNECGVTNLGLNLAACGEHTISASGLGMYYRTYAIEFTSRRASETMELEFVRLQCRWWQI